LRRTRDNFFGIGPRTSRLLETNYSVESRSFNGVFSHKFTKKLEGGVYGRFSNTGSFNGENDQDPLLDTLFSGDPLTADTTRYLPGLNSNVELFQYGAYGEFDLRNNDRGLTQGGYFYGRIGSVDGLKNGNAFSDYGWIETELDGRVYIPVLSRKTSIALRAFADLKEPKRGSQIPFYELSWLGGRSYLRGFQNYRFRANNLALFQGEFRQTVWPQEEDQGVDVIVFVDGGQVWGDNRSKINPAILANDRFLDENWRIGTGGGVQYRMNKSTAFRFDVGTTNERTQIFFSLSRGF
jgi:outer membrane protein assembly factor BamA